MCDVMQSICSLFLPQDIEIDEAKKILQEYMNEVDAL